MIKIYQKIEGFVLRIIEKLENQRITLGGWLLSFFAIVFLRTFLEALSTNLDYFQFESEPYVSFLFFHTPAFFLLGILFFILLLHFLTKEISKNTFLNIMDQYIPYFRAKEFPKLNRPIINEEYQEAINLVKKSGLKRLY